MVLIRPVAMDDLDGLVRLAELAGAGLTTLPRDRDLLRKRILKSQRGMENIPDRPGGEHYVFVMADPDSGRVVGASGIVSKVGGFEPFYAYRLDSQTIDSELLNVHKKIQLLRLVREHDGPAEVGSLFLDPDYRKQDYGRFLQLVRFLFVAEHPEAFSPTIVSELRGVIDPSGRSPFWDAVGKHFFEIDFPKADYLSVVNKKFIADLMPRHPIYVSLLPAEAQRVIGQVHESSKPAMKNLEAEGFRFNGMVDIFDAGPCVGCARDQVRTVRQSRTAVVDRLSEKIESPLYMIGRRSGEFRACIGPVQIGDAEQATISGQCAEALKIKPGDPIRIAPLRPTRDPLPTAASTSTSAHESD